MGRDGCGDPEGSVQFPHRRKSEQPPVTLMEWMITARLSRTRSSADSLSAYRRLAVGGRGTADVAMWAGCQPAVQQAASLRCRLRENLRGARKPLWMAGQTNTRAWHENQSTKIS